MGKIFFTGDLHFGHANVIAFDNRPFKTVEEMDAELIRRWNNKVGKGDLTYVLGDMIWKARNDDAPELIKSLNGQIILIKGNHDRFLHNAQILLPILRRNGRIGCHQLFQIVRIGLHAKTSLM